ncbi:GumC family protein [Spirosoma pollinicola]|uniref:Lipopolysaccharide biosynthesis protein n=1 Tax=Spirosoma pollinicola TaxID=2057025 RepID=A0A2K8Z788_9BACT|nr:hypothetical protein [Spirosoma pollinicola]AUD05742.1 hypothetical protein CWM47_30195 [Spirosoma pollinicola]
MTLATVFRVLRKNLIWLLLFPVMVTCTVAYLTGDLPRSYIATATVYTGFASGMSIVENNTKTTSQEIGNAFDNLITTIKSRETLTEVSLHLLAYHLSLRKASPDKLSKKSFDDLQKLRNTELKGVSVGYNELATLKKLERLAGAQDGNAIKKLLYQSNSPYSVESILGRITVSRKNSSDMLELSCKADDPAICQQTLVFLIDTFQKRYQAIRASENGTVVKYFENQAQTIQQHLKSAEDQLTDYGVQNKIINYAEQSKYTAEAKEATSTEYVHEKMQQQAAQASLVALERKLDDNASVLLANGDVTKKRNELAKIQTRLANAMVYEQPPAEIAKLQATTDQLSAELKVAVRRLYNSTNTVESIPKQDLLTDYVEQTLKLQGSNARLNVLKTRVQEYAGIYNDLAPQGSAIHRLERKIGLAEQEYLFVLHGLNMARLRQKDLEMTGSMGIIDAPALPMKSQPSIRSMLVAVSFIGSLVLLIAVLLGKEVVNGSIQTPERAEQLSGIPLAAAFPLISKLFARYDLDYIERCMVEKLRTRLLIDITVPDTDEWPPYRLITLLGTQEKQGKTWVGERISHRLVKAGHRVCYLYPADAEEKPETDAQTIAYPVNSDFADTRTVGVLLQGVEAADLPEFDYVFLELPSLLTNAMPVHLVGQSHLSLLVLHAKSTWSKADEGLKVLVEKASHHALLTVLNGVEADLLEPLLGKIPQLKKKKSSKAAQPKPLDLV